MRIAVLLPHLKAFGGVRRFLELGNVFAARDHEYTIHLPAPTQQNWFECKGIVFARDEVISAEVVICSNGPQIIEPAFRNAKGARYVWAIGGGAYYLGLYKRAPKDARFLVNNRSLLPEFKALGGRLVEGGVNTEFFSPKKRRVLYLGIGRGPKKGEDVIREALGDLPHVELIGVQGLSNTELREAYHSADCLVSWEQHDGWGNGAAEAVACGLQVVTNGRNVQPFADRVIVLENEASELRRFFENPMSEFSWWRVADRLMEIWREDRIPGA